MYYITSTIIITLSFFFFTVFGQELQLRAAGEGVACNVLFFLVIFFLTFLGKELQLSDAGEGVAPYKLGFHLQSIEGCGHVCVVL